MEINGTKIYKLGIFYKFIYETNVIMLKKNGSEYLPIYFTTTTVEDDRQKDYFKENCKNILVYLKNNNYKGIIINNYNKLTDVAKAAILVGVGNGWIIEKELLSTYIIEEIN